MSRAIGALVRKLHAWELLHLREHAADLQAENERLRDQVEELTRQRDYAEDCARSWHDDVMQMMEDGLQVGLTKSGRVVAMPASGVAQ